MLRFSRLFSRALWFSRMSQPYCHLYLDGNLNVLLAEVGDVHLEDNLLSHLLRTLDTALQASLYAIHLMLAMACPCLFR